ncbi:MAG: NAD(P)H-binding protein [Anaerolineae bacterium]
MENQTGLSVVLGATGGAGQAVVEELVKQGRPVRAVNRSGKADLPASVEVAKADATNVDSLKAVCAGAAVVYHCVNVPYDHWLAEFPPLTSNIIEAASSVGAKLVVADNLYMYGKVDGPISADLPYAATTRKGKLRAQLSDMLMEAHRSGKVRVAIGRGSDFFGPGAPKAIAGADYFRAVLAGKKAMWVGSLDQPHSLTYLPDFGRGLVVLGTREEALGQAWIIPTDKPLTGREFGTLAFEEAGLPPKVGTNSALMVRIAGIFSPFIREVNEMMYQFDEPFIVDGSKFAQAIGPFAPTPTREAIRQTLEWFKAHPA